jgi:hypothetical protein
MSKESPLKVQQGRKWVKRPNIAVMRTIAMADGILFDA